MVKESSVMAGYDFTKNIDKPLQAKSILLKEDYIN